MDILQCLDMGLFGFGKSKIDKRKEDWVIEAKNWCDQGNSLAKLGKDQEAIACYDKALSLDSEDLRALFNKGNALANLKKFEESIECFNQVIEKNPEYPSALRYKGVALKKLGRDEEAEYCFTKDKESE